MEAEYDHSKEAIYQDLLVLTSEIELVKLSPTLEKRDFVMKELLDTEKNYAEVLGKLKKNFMNPLKNINKMKAEDHKIIFYKISELFDIHCSFYNELVKTKSDPMVKLSNIFMKFREKFLVYGEYCANLTRATSLLQDICDNNPTFNQIVLDIEKEYNNGRFKLRDVLSVPMQRILKYHLLLEKLIENTDPNHEEYNDLRRSREAMLDVATYINEAARDSEHLAVINKLQDNIVEWDIGDNRKLVNYGRLLKDIELKIKAHDDQKTRTRYVFIFDKCILICKQLKGAQFAFRSIINIADYHVEEINNRSTLNREARWAFQFYLVKNDNNTAYTISVRSRELRDQMMKAINDARDSLFPPAMKHTNHSFELQTFAEPVQCLHCSKYLKGLFFQGYKCSVCSIACHKQCIAGSGRCGAPHPHSHSSMNGSPENSLYDKLWFVGEMDRAAAQQKLERRENGTYLVRIRPQRDNRDDAEKYALSLKTDNTVKHMKILCQIMSDQKKYFLSLSKFFNSIEELVQNYQVYSLKENFERLGQNTILEWPYRQLQAVAIRNYKPQDDKELELIDGKRIRVIGQDGYREGWWRGCTDFNEPGYFPSSFVRVEEWCTFLNITRSQSDIYLKIADSLAQVNSYSIWSSTQIVQYSRVTSTNILTNLE